MNIEHTPVLLKESIDALNVKENGRFIDCNFGGGGHSKRILESGGTVLGLDVDESMIDKAQMAFRTEIENGKLQVLNENFRNIEQACKKIGWELGSIDGILYDLGLSTFQLKEEKKGFSFEDDVPMDMRMDERLSVTANDLIIGLSEGELARLLSRFGEEPQAKSFAKAIKEAVAKSSDHLTARQIAKVIKNASRYSKSRIHPATRVFQALRIAVNSELDNLQFSLTRATLLLKPTGRLVIISFHSLEDKIAKNLAKSPDLELVNGKPIVPSEEEVSKNPSSRSAKMRVYQKLVSEKI